MSNEKSLEKRKEKELVVLPFEKAIFQLPVGSKISIEVEREGGLHEKYRSVFLGVQPGVGILLKTPCASSVKHSILLKENNVITVRGLSTQGTGAIMAFRSTIMRHYKPPFPMILTSQPTDIQMHLLRNEPRFSLDLIAEVLSDEQTFRGGVEDISLSGCCFCCTKAHQFHADDKIDIKLEHIDSDKFFKLKGTVKNLRKKEGAHYIGIAFDQDALDEVNAMLQEMILKGAQRTIS